MSDSSSIGEKRATEISPLSNLDAPTKRLKVQEEGNVVPSSSGSLAKEAAEDISVDPTEGDNSATPQQVQADESPEEGTGEPSSKHRDANERAGSRKTKKKDMRNMGRRRRGTRPESPSAEGDAGRPLDEPKEPRLPKRQCALLIGFCGSGFRGMQFQRLQPGLPEQRTIEGELFKALVAAGAVSKDNADDPVKVNFGRAARTDAGVHAAGNVVSMKMITTVPGVDDMLAHINSKLPPEIRLWGFQRVQNSFNARTLCDGRKYTYFFPSYLLIPPKPGSGLDCTLKAHAASLSCEVSYSSDPFWSPANSAETSVEDDLVRKRAWRATAAHVERLREVVKRFEKTHNFHNFTVTQDPKDRSNQRYMKKIEIAEPAVYGETEWIAVALDGQSFMLHQRKMMFALVMISRTGTPSSIIDELYGLSPVHIPKMPALGLLLEYPVFDVYSLRIAASNEKLDPSDPQYRAPLNFEQYTEQMNTFKQKYIYDNMRGIEDRKGLFDAWIRSVDAYTGNDLLYLNPLGVIPAESVVKRGERRENPFKEQRKFNMTSFATDDNVKMKAEQEENDVDVDEPLNRKQMEEAEG